MEQNVQAEITEPEQLELAIKGREFLE